MFSKIITGLVIDVPKEETCHNWSVCVHIPVGNGIREAKWLPIVYPGTMNNKSFWLPEVDEQVVCIMDESLEFGYVIGAVYSEGDDELSPDSIEHVRSLEMATDTDFIVRMIKDLDSGEALNEIVMKKGEGITLTCEDSSVKINNDGSIVCTAKDSVLEMKPDGKVHITTDLIVHGEIKAVGNIITQADVKTPQATLNTHQHTGNLGGPTPLIPVPDPSIQSDPDMM